jgi:4-amino-4-deoxy-L-arabinose transferase-like glycosyltransferase
VFTLKTKQEKILLLILITVSIIALFFKLGDRSLENNDRILYAEVARETVQSGDWMVLHHNGGIYLHKPPLLIWFIAIPAHIYGAVTPFIARLPSAVSALLGIVLIFFFGKQIYRNATAGFLSSLILLSCYSYSRHARAAQTDMLLCLFIILSLFLFYTSYNTQKEGKRLLYFLLSCVAVGLGVMVKGPNGFLIPVFTAIIFLAYKRDFKTFCKLPYLFGIVVFAAVVLPWSIILCNKLGGVTATLTELQEINIFRRREDFYFYFIEVPKRLFPWSVFIPAAFFYLFSRRHKPDGTDAGNDRFFPLIWFVTMFVILSIPECKNTRYMLPAYPALALMVGGMWHYALSAKNRVLEKWLNPSIFASLIILLIVLIAAPVFFFFKYQYLFPIIMCTSIVFLCAIPLLYLYKRAKIHQWSFAVITAFYILAQCIHVHALSVEDIRHSPGRDLAMSVSKCVKGDELIAYNLPVKYTEPLNFYMNRIMPALKKQEGIYKALTSSKPIYLIMRENDYQSLDEDLKAMIKFEKEVFYKNKQLVLFSNKQGNNPE